MGRNQLFRILPDQEMALTILDTFGLTSFEDTNYFTKQTIQENQTVQKLNDIKDSLETYYLPCKAKVYLDNITEKRCITILKQFIRIHGYTLISKERYIDRTKVCVYRLIKEDDKESKPKKIKDKQIILSFE